MAAAFCLSLLYSIQWLFLFTIETEYVYCAVRPENLNIIWVNLGFQIRLSPVRILPPMLPTHVSRHVPLTRMANGRSLGTFKGNALSDMGVNWIEKDFHSLFERFSTSTTWKLQIMTPL